MLNIMRGGALVVACCGVEVDRCSRLLTLLRDELPGQMIEKINCREGP